MQRIKNILLLLIITFSSGCSEAKLNPDLVKLRLYQQQIWEDFKQQYIFSDGRVFDFYKGMTHSEGQGYGLLLAHFFDEKNLFDQIWHFTKTEMQTRKSDELISWSYGSADKSNIKKKDSNSSQYTGSKGKRIETKPRVLDRNNATDGDILIAWSLLLASEKWGNPLYKEAALGILKDIANLLIYTDQNKGIWLKPGAFGFVKEKSIRINAAYYVIPAFIKFSEIDTTNRALWERLLKSTKQVFIKSSLPTLNLISDWLDITNELQAIPSKEFGAEAVRVWLYQCITPKSKSRIYETRYLGFDAWNAFNQKHDHFPDKYRVEGSTVGSAIKGQWLGVGMPGYGGISACVNFNNGKVNDAIRLWKKAILQRTQQENPVNYYSDALLLISMIPIESSMADEF